MTSNTCNAPGCEKPRHARDLCSMHDARMKRHGELEPAGLAMRGASLEAQYRAKVDQRGPNECWPWKAFVSPDGYGKFNRSPVGQLAHRYSWFLRYGPIPPGFVVDHTCHDPAECTGGKACPHRQCQNPRHMTLVRPVRNGAEGRRRMPNSDVTHCPAGHPYSPENTLWSTRRSTGREYRQCRACARERARKRARD